MESPSNWIYELMMKKVIPNTLVWLLIVGLLSVTRPISAGSQAVFLILAEGIDLATEADRLETLGARIQQRVPPQILVAELPDSLREKRIPSVKTSYFSAIPLSALEPMGSVALAAGMQWNRRMLAHAKSLNPQSFGAMRAMVAQKSLTAPAHLTAVFSDTLIQVVWNAIPSAFSYEIQAALDGNFSKHLATTHTNTAGANLPPPDGNGPVAVYLRVRGIDHAQGVHRAEDDVVGAWSGLVALSVQAAPIDTSLAAPVLTSPLPNYESEGTTIILEWSGDPSLKNEIQVSRNEKFEVPLFNEVLRGNEFICPSTTLHAGDVLSWRVRISGAKKGPWSSVRRFTVGAPRHSVTDMFINPEAPK